MKHTLIITSSHLLLVSDSLPELGDIALETLITGEKEMFAIDHLEDIDENTQVKILGSIPQIDSHPILDVTSIEEELNKRGWFDVLTITSDYIDNNPKRVSKEQDLLLGLGFLKGFNKRAELNKAAVYTEEDMQKAFRHGNIRSREPFSKLTEYYNAFIQSLQQSKTSMEVEVEKECGEERQCECIDNSHCLKPQPKITNNCIKILRIK